MASATDFGSSPRVRGTLQNAPGRRAGLRFIPACAGNSAATAGRPRPGPVHPRVCGELEQAHLQAEISNGSSPRVRGTPAPARPPTRRTTVHPRVCGELRDNLAGAVEAHGSSPRVRGTRRRPAPAARSPTVHPRVCGELRAERPQAPLEVGSSPRVRGTLLLHHHAQQEMRFIPACAGNSRLRMSRVAPLTVHPRVCGELAFDGASARASCGSSPRVRGTRRPRPMRRAPRRFIPACAGNSTAGRRAARAARVHPRVCGELVRARRRARRAHRFIPACAGNSGDGDPGLSHRDGSSPRVRGTRRGEARLRGRLRFIPACAGNSYSKSFSVAAITVHPRVCGELSPRPAQGSPALGSSPRVRGTRRVTRVIQLCWRFIPACAGNSLPARPTRRSAPVHPRVCGELGDAPRL